MTTIPATCQRSCATAAHLTQPARTQLSACKFSARISHFMIFFGSHRIYQEYLEWKPSTSLICAGHSYGTWNDRWAWVWLQSAEVMRRELTARHEASVRGLLTMLSTRKSTAQQQAAAQAMLSSLPLPAVRNWSLHQQCCHPLLAIHHFDAWCVCRLECYEETRVGCWLGQWLSQRVMCGSGGVTDLTVVCAVLINFCYRSTSIICRGNWSTPSGPLSATAGAPACPLRAAGFLLFPSRMLA